MEEMKKSFSEENAWMDNLLKEDPEYMLSDDFADKLITKIDAVESVKQSVYEFLMIVGVIVVILSTFLVTYYFFKNDDFITLSSILNNGYTLSIAVIALFILFADKVLLSVLSQLKRL
jgi:hydrogenase-4 membrane subunit HyfE